MNKTNGCGFIHVFVSSPPQEPPSTGSPSWPSRSWTCTCSTSWWRKREAWWRLSTRRSGEKSQRDSTCPHPSPAPLSLCAHSKPRPSLSLPKMKKQKGALLWNWNCLHIIYYYSHFTCDGLSPELLALSKPAPHLSPAKTEPWEITQQIFQLEKLSLNK